jgi:hypothetical protein
MFPMPWCTKMRQDDDMRTFRRSGIMSLFSGLHRKFSLMGNLMRQKLVMMNLECLPRASLESGSERCFAPTP